MQYAPDQIARVVHEANRALQQINGDDSIAVSPSWDDESQETRASAVDGVRGVLNGNTPEQSHENWCEFKLAHGWKYGPTKDTDAKTHPCLVPYAELPDHERVKDSLFVAVVGALKPAEEH